MKIGFVGLGKLGFPVASYLATQGHDVLGYDVRDIDPQAPWPHMETGPDGRQSFDTWRRDLPKPRIVGRMEDLAEQDIIFVAVPTPHRPEHEGVTCAPKEAADFDYGPLRDAAYQLDMALPLNWPGIIAVISTVLPGTIRQWIWPQLRPRVVVYNPSFIAMGTTIPDYCRPEFVLIGITEPAHCKRVLTLTNLYRNVTHGAPIKTIGLESAELVKVAYNAWISQKITLANTLMEICDKVPGADIDQVSEALSMANRRLWSPAYTRGGMGDGGGCHPRDNIAMHALANSLQLSTDPFLAVTRAREDQSYWLAGRLLDAQREAGADGVWVLGTAYKPGTNLDTGSPARLLMTQVKAMAPDVPVRAFDPYVNSGYRWDHDGRPVAALIGCKHDEFTRWDFPPGSVIVDPHRYIPDRPGVTVWRIGEGR